jgi:hypothetical protein
MTGITKKAGDLRLRRRTGLLVSLILGLALLLCVRASAMDGETGGSADDEMKAFLDKHTATLNRAGGKTRLSRITMVTIWLENMKAEDIPQTGWEALEKVSTVKFTGHARFNEGIYSLSEKEEEALNTMLPLVKKMPKLEYLALSRIKLGKVSKEVFMIEQVSDITLYEVECSRIVFPMGHVLNHIKTMMLFHCSCEEDGSFKQLKSMIPEVTIIPEPNENHTSSEGSPSGCTGASSMEA